jgi:predicted nucleotidyltransferase
MIVVGAGARLLIFDRVFNKRGRFTEDWDIAVSIESWQTYEQLRNHLIGGDSPLFKATKSLHKIIHIKTNIEIDIVPFGEIGEPDRKIIFPDSENLMNTSGLIEALTHAIIERINDVEIPVINLPAFVVLKIFAWGDRSAKKDLEDLEFILSKYEDDERAYEELAEELASGEIDFLDASIYLLGRDIYKILQFKTLVELHRVFGKLMGKLGDDETGSFGYRLNILQKGIYSLSSNPLPQKLPFLEAIAWQTEDVYRLTPEEMISRYERGWNARSLFNNLEGEELEFLKQLAKTYPSGLQAEL